ncbi:unnamed protein product [Brassica rapa subsp. narinosa]|uniref:(rape) hypothetical protein n=1 Tax=Brassica napus TaxID=3708 RepID=A0A816U9N6_BRANA|nr:unnamed protein product [Brassica napus]
MEFFPLLELPEEIQAVVVERAARNSIQDLFGLKASSRSMKALAKRRGVYHFLDVLSVPWELNMPYELLKACYAERNPSTLYIKGVQFFYSFDLKEEGLSLMKRAADAGYEGAVYTYAMTRAIFWGEGKYLSRIPSDTFSFAQNGLYLSGSGSKLSVGNGPVFNPVISPNSTKLNLIASSTTRLHISFLCTRSCLHSR